MGKKYTVGRRYSGIRTHLKISFLSFPTLDQVEGMSDRESRIKASSLRNTDIFYYSAMDYSKQKEFFAQAYDLGEKRMTSKYAWPLEIDPQIIAFHEKIKYDIPRGKVLDLGCGQGRHALYFAEKGYDAYGIDYIERAINEAKQEAANRDLDTAHFQVMDLLALRFPKDTFDIIVDWSVLDHIYPTEWELYLVNILNVLKRGGYLMLTEFSADDVRVTEKSNNSFFDRNSYNHCFRRDELEYIFSKNFQFIEYINTMMPPSYTVVNALLRRNR